MSVVSIHQDQYINVIDDSSRAVEAGGPLGRAPLDRSLEELSAELDDLCGQTDTYVYPAYMRPETFFQKLNRLNAERKTALNPPGSRGSQTQAGYRFALDRSNACPVKGDNTPNPTPSSAPLTSASSAASASTETVKAPPKKASQKTAPKKFGRAVELAKRQSGYAFTLNLSQARECSLRRSDDPARAMSDFINRAFKRLSQLTDLPAPGYGFVLEISPAGRLHLHGTIILGGHNLEAVRSALKEAGGKIKGHAAGPQLLTKPVFLASGWTQYCGEDAFQTMQVLGTRKITFLSAGLRRLVIDDPKQAAL